MSVTPASETVRLKAALREEAAQRRKEAHAACPDGGTLLVRIFETSALSDLVPARGTVSGYSPIRSEIDPRPLMKQLQEQGLVPALPVIPDDPGPLAFRVWNMNKPLERHGFGTRVPRAEGAQLIKPDMVLLPLLAFDRRGGRLGYGGGYYDRTLAHLRVRKEVLAIGLAFGAQEMDAVPMTPLDVRLDWVLTENEAIRCAT